MPCGHWPRPCCAMTAWSASPWPGRPMEPRWPWSWPPAGSRTPPTWARCGPDRRRRRWVGRIGVGGGRDASRIEEALAEARRLPGVSQIGGHPRTRGRGRDRVPVPVVRDLVPVKKHPSALRSSPAGAEWGRVVALDLGKCCIGVAYSDGGRTLASPGHGGAERRPGATRRPWWRRSTKSARNCRGRAALKPLGCQRSGRAGGAARGGGLAPDPRAPGHRGRDGR